MTNKRDDLGYLGLEFQYRLAHHFMDDKKFFRDVFEIVDNNMFTEGNLKQFIGSMKNYYSTYEHVPSYDELEIEMRSKSRNDQDLDFIVATIEKVKETTLSGGDSIKEKAHKFFKQQNLVKSINQINEIVKLGDVDRYPECEEIIRRALVTGNKDEIGVKLRDNIGEVLSEDYRKTIPTGVDGIDESLEGGLGKGELGVIIGPSGFGKTSLSTCYVNHAASIGFKALQIVFEDKEKQIQRKHYGRITGIESRNLSKPENIQMVSDMIHNTDKFDDNLIIKKFNTGEATVPMIKNYIKKLINTGFKPDMVVIDYFECIVPTKQYKDVYQSEGHTMRELESLASDLDFALWVPTQGTKDSLGLDVVTMDKAGGSFKKIQIAHVVMSIARSLEDIENNIATIAILKNRSGKSGAVMEGIYFNNGTCTIDTSRANVFSDHSKWVEAEKERMVDMTSDLLNSINERRNNNNNK